MKQFRDLADKIIAPGIAYPGKRTEIQATPLKLLYQDGDACSAGHIFIDVYEKDQDKFMIVVDGSHAQTQGGYDCEDIHQIMKSDNIVDLLDILADNRFFDGNMCSDFLGDLSNELKCNFRSYKELYEKNIDFAHYIPNLNTKRHWNSKEESGSFFEK